MAFLTIGVVLSGRTANEPVTKLNFDYKTWPDSFHLKFDLIRRLESPWFERNGFDMNEILAPFTLQLMVNGKMVETSEPITLQDDDTIELVPMTSE
jgi:hypothetical protein